MFVQPVLSLLTHFALTSYHFTAVFLAQIGRPARYIEHIRVLILLKWSSAHWSFLEKTQNTLWELTCVECDLMAAMTLTKQMELIWQIELFNHRSEERNDPFFGSFTRLKSRAILQLRIQSS